jgi:hypothetical protein
MSFRAARQDERMANWPKPLAVKLRDAVYYGGEARLVWCGMH